RPPPGRHRRRTAHGRKSPRQPPRPGAGQADRAAVAGIPVIPAPEPSCRKRGPSKCTLVIPAKHSAEPGSTRTKAPWFKKTPDNRIRDLRGYGLKVFCVISGHTDRRRASAIPIQADEVESEAASSLQHRCPEMRINELISEAESLPVEERARVIDSLLRSMNPPKPAVDSRWAKI